MPERRRIDATALSWYEGAGLDLIPLHRWDDVRDGRRIGKAALDGGWQSRDYSTPEERARLLELIAQGHNVGVRPRAGWLVADYDSRRDPDGLEWADFVGALARDGIDLRDVPTVEIGRGEGSKHLLLRYPADVPVAVSSIRWPAFDFKHGHAGHQVVSAGSIHPDTGREYRAIDWPPAVEAPMVGDNVLQHIRRLDVVRSNAGEAQETEGCISVEQLRALLAQLNPADWRQHEDWLNLGMACWHGCGGSAAACAAFAEWSAQDPEYGATGAASVAARWATWDWRGKEAPVTVR